MTLYFFHLDDGGEILIDEDGIDLPDLRAAKAKALCIARDTLSHDLRSGTVDLSLCIKVEDRVGNLVHSLPLDQAFAASQR